MQFATVLLVAIVLMMMVELSETRGRIGRSRRSRSKGSSSKSKITKCTHANQSHLSSLPGDRLTDSLWFAFNHVQESCLCQLAAPPPFQQCPSLSDGISNVPELCLHPEEESSEGYLWERKAAGWQWKFVFGYISREPNTEGRNRRQLGWIDNYSEVQKWRNENTTRSRQNSVAGRHQGARLWSCKPCPLQLDYCDGNNLYKGWNDHRRNDGYHVRDKSERLKQTEHQQHTTSVVITLLMFMNLHPLPCWIKRTNVSPVSICSGATHSHLSLKKW